MLQLRFLRHTQTQERYILRNFGRMTDEPFWQGSENTKSPEWEPVGDILINSGSLHALARLIEPPKGAN